MKLKSPNESIVVLKIELENIASIICDRMEKPTKTDTNAIESLLALDDYLSKLAGGLNVSLPQVEDSMIEMLEQVVNPNV
jgi:hypothetical protein